MTRMVQPIVAASARVSIVGVVLVVAAASASAPKAHDVKKSTNVSHGFDQTWSAVVDMFADHNWAIMNIDKASGLITTDWMNLSSDDMRYVDCGSEGMSTIVATQVKFNVRVKGDDTTSNVTVNTAFRQQRRFDNVSSIIDCTSRGSVEREIQAAVSEGATRTVATKKPTAQPAAAPAAARGFFCSTSPTNPKAGLCAREKAECQRTRDAAIVGVTDLSECALTETAWCSGDRCAPNQEICGALRERAGSGAVDCVETK